MQNFNTFDLNATKKHNKWVKWLHNWYLPAYTNTQKTANAASTVLPFGRHCGMCLNINGCCFPITNMPRYPLHDNCHCYFVEINEINAIAVCDINKFEKYIFNENNKINKGKKSLFESRGYAKIDSAYLQNEYEKQAKARYESGEYSLGTVDLFGQRITVKIILPRKNKIGVVVLSAGFLVYPDGKIMLTTPYAGS